MSLARLRRRLLAASLAAASLPGALGLANAAPLQMRGFRGLMWGDPPSYLTHRVEVSREGPVRCYQRDSENLLFGDSALRAVRYCFHADRFFMAVLEPLADPASLRTEFERGYGPPDHSGASFARWGGRNSRVTAEIGPPTAGARVALRLVAHEFAR